MDKHLLMWDFLKLPNTGSSLKRFIHPTDCHGQREIAQVGADNKLQRSYTVQFAYLCVYHSHSAASFVKKITRWVYLDNAVWVTLFTVHPVSFLAAYSARAPAHPL